MNFVIRSFKPEEYDMVRKWGNLEQFDRGVYDFQAFALLDKQTFWIGELNGEPIASIGAVQYSENFAFLGLYYVKPQHRGSGYGIQIWRKALAHITATNIGLECGTSKAEIKYMSEGFKTYHKTYLYTIGGKGKPYESEFLVKCQDIDFNKLTEYDQKTFSAERNTFLEKWINLPESHAIAFVRNGQIEGYGVIRLSDEGHRIGPLFADSYEIAEQILKNLIGSVEEGKRIRIDLPSTNQDGAKLAKNFYMTKIWKCMRMYTKQQPFKNINTVYGMTSLEMG